MTKMRQVPEDRIKRLEVFGIFPKEMLEVVPETFVANDLCRQMGEEIARKLFEFHKVLITNKDDGNFNLVAKGVIEVIVPKGPPQ